MRRCWGAHASKQGRKLPYRAALAHSSLCSPSPPHFTALPYRWEWLEPVLARIAALNGNVTAWRQLPPDQIILHVG